MQAIMEPIFEIPYLVGVVILGILVIKNARGNSQYTLFGIMAIVLGCGDAFHLVPRMWALLTVGTTTHLAHVCALGFGKMVTSITMTIFYVMLYHVWQKRYKQYSKGLTVCVYTLAICRIILCLMPQNKWLTPDAPLIWGIYRNIPFLMLGAIIIVVYFRQAKLNHDRSFRFMWLAVTLSFLFYIPVVLFADSLPMIGMLMIPKTCAYVWIILMGFTESKREDYVTKKNIL